MPAQTTYLELATERHDKFYEITLDDAEVRLRFGQISATTSGRKKHLSFNSVAEARAEASRRLRAKLRKGYVPAEDRVDDAALARAEALEREARAPVEGRAWNLDDPAAPPFPDAYEVVQRATLQKTDLERNNNKYYTLELHHADTHWRLFTHYGRTDDLARDPHAGRKQARHYSSQASAAEAYRRLYQQKTRTSKGYREVHLVRTRVGSERARGHASGQLDDATRTALRQGQATAAARRRAEDFDDQVADLVGMLFDEATEAVTRTLDARITSTGIETPLGTLTLGQLDEGESILRQLLTSIHEAAAGADRTRALARLSGAFYSVIPHRLGRSRQALAEAVIDSPAAVARAEETLQLLRDLINVDGADVSVLHDPSRYRKYRALGCLLRHVSPDEAAHLRVRRLVERSQIKTDSVRVQRIFAVQRPDEARAFDRSVGNEHLLFHGSAARNWVGILSRGLLMPRIVTELGVVRTDFGWLGNGLYFGDAACTTLYYAAPCARGTRLLGVHRVALGLRQLYHAITPGLSAPAPCHDSVHGVRCTPQRPTHFEDDEFVIYRPQQQRLAYLVEYTV